MYASVQIKLLWIHFIFVTKVRGFHVFNPVMRSMLHVFCRRGRVNDYISSSCLMFMIKGVSEERWEVYFGVIEREKRLKMLMGVYGAKWV